MSLLTVRQVAVRLNVSIQVIYACAPPAVCRTAASASGGRSAYCGRSGRLPSCVSRRRTRGYALRRSREAATAPSASLTAGLKHRPPSTRGSDRPCRRSLGDKLCGCRLAGETTPKVQVEAPFHTARFAGIPVRGPALCPSTILVGTSRRPPASWPANITLKEGAELPFGCRSQASVVARRCRRGRRQLKLFEQGVAAYRGRRDKKRGPCRRQSFDHRPWQSGRQRGRRGEEVCE
jgi:hypothetical protein